MPIHFVEFQHDKYDKGGLGVEELEQVESSVMGVTGSRTFELVSVKGSVAPTTRSGGCGEKMKIVHNARQLILDGIFRCQDKRFKVSTSSDSSWNLFSVVVPYCNDLLKRKKV